MVSCLLSEIIIYIFLYLIYNIPVFLPPDIWWRQGRQSTVLKIRRSYPNTFSGDHSCCSFYTFSTFNSFLGLVVSANSGSSVWTVAELMTVFHLIWISQFKSKDTDGTEEDGGHWSVGNPESFLRPSGSKTPPTTYPQSISILRP